MENTLDQFAVQDPDLSAEDSDKLLQLSAVLGSLQQPGTMDSINNLVFGIAKLAFPEVSLVWNLEQHEIAVNVLGLPVNATVFVPIHEDRDGYVLGDR